MKENGSPVYSYSSDDSSPSSSSEHTTSSLIEIRGLRLFRIIGQRLGKLRRRSQNQVNKENNHEEDEEEVDDGFSSSSSCDSAGRNTSFESPIHRDKIIFRRSMDGRSSSTDRISTNRSLSDKRSSVLESSTQQKKTTRSILRAPVSYVYTKGLSGLPTQRVPICRGRCNCYVQSEVFRSYEDLYHHRYVSFNR